MTMSARLRPLAAAALAALAALAIAACGGSGAGLIPSANAGTLQTDFEEVAQLARSGNGSCTATRAALEKTEGDLFSLPDGINRELRARLAQGIAKLHEVALARCTQRSTTSTTTSTTTRTETTAPPAAQTVTTVTTVTTAAAPATSSAGPQGPAGGGTPAPEGGGENQEGRGGEAGAGEAGGGPAHGLAPGQGGGR
jgi:hypothetical protein